METKKIVGIIFLFLAFGIVNVVFGATPISSCGQTLTPGEYYLTNDLEWGSGACLNVTGSGTIIVNLNGHTIRPTSDSLYLFKNYDHDSSKVIIVTNGSFDSNPSGLTLLFIDDWVNRIEIHNAQSYNLYEIYVYSPKVIVNNTDLNNVYFEACDGHCEFYNVNSSNRVTCCYSTAFINSSLNIVESGSNIPDQIINTNVTRFDFPSIPSEISCPSTISNSYAGGYEIKKYTGALSGLLDENWLTFICYANGDVEFDGVQYTPTERTYHELYIVDCSNLNIKFLANSYGKISIKNSDNIYLDFNGYHQSNIYWYSGYGKTLNVKNGDVGYIGMWSWYLNLNAENMTGNQWVFYPFNTVILDNVTLDSIVPNGCHVEANNSKINELYIYDYETSSNITLYNNRYNYWHVYYCSAYESNYTIVENDTTFTTLLPNLNWNCIDFTKLLYVLDKDNIAWNDAVTSGSADLRFHFEKLYPSTPYVFSYDTTTQNYVTDNEGKLTTSPVSVSSGTSYDFSLSMAAFPPTIEIYSPQNTTYLTSTTTTSITLNFKVYGSDNTYTVKAYLDGSEIYSNSSFANDTAYVDTIIVDAGTHTLIVNATGNDYGLSSEESVVFTVEQVSAPVVDIISPENTTYCVDSVDLKYVVTGEYIDKCWYVLDGVEHSLPACENVTITGLSEGVHDLKVYANNTLGDVGYDEVVFTTDLNAPVVTIIKPENTTYTTTSVQLTYVVEDVSTATCQYELDGSLYDLPNCENTTITVDIGTHLVKVYATDACGRSSSDEIVFTVAKPTTAAAWAIGLASILILAGVTLIIVRSFLGGSLSVELLVSVTIIAILTVSCVVMLLSLV